MSPCIGDYGSWFPSNSNSSVLRASCHDPYTG
jgi:hypothetical protein